MASMFKPPPEHYGIEPEDYLARVDRVAAKMVALSNEAGVPYDDMPLLRPMIVGLAEEGLSPVLPQTMTDVDNAALAQRGVTIEEYIASATEKYPMINWERIVRGE